MSSVGEAKTYGSKALLSIIHDLIRLQQDLPKGNPDNVAALNAILEYENGVEKLVSHHKGIIRYLAGVLSKPHLFQFGPDSPMSKTLLKYGTELGDIISGLDRNIRNIQVFVLNLSQSEKQKPFVALKSFELEINLSNFIQALVKEKTAKSEAELKETSMKLKDQLQMIHNLVTQHAQQTLYELLHLRDMQPAAENPEKFFHEIHTLITHCTKVVQVFEK